MKPRSHLEAVAALADGVDVSAPGAKKEPSLDTELALALNTIENNARQFALLRASQIETAKAHEAETQDLRREMVELKEAFKAAIRELVDTLNQPVVPEYDSKTGRVIRAKRQERKVNG